MGVGLSNHPARLAALAAGEKTFDTGEPCAKGHTSPRYTGFGLCVQCNRLHKRKQMEAQRLARGEDPNMVRKPGRPKKVSSIKPIPQPHHVIQYRPRSPVSPLHSALTEYRNSSDARERSEHLDNCLKNYVASAIKKVPHNDEAE